MMNNIENSAVRYAAALDLLVMKTKKSGLLSTEDVNEILLVADYDLIKTEKEIDVINISREE